MELDWTAVGGLVNGLSRGSKDFVFSVAGVGYKIWSGRSSYLWVSEKVEEG